MKVMLVFDPAFKGADCDALWIVDSEANRHWFEGVRDKIDPNSAIFHPDAPAMTILWAVQEHHPSWTVIEAVGLPLSDEVVLAMLGDGMTVRTETGFQLLKNG